MGDPSHAVDNSFSDQSTGLRESWEKVAREANQKADHTTTFLMRPVKLTEPFKDLSVEASAMWRQLYESQGVLGR